MICWQTVFKKISSYFPFPMHKAKTPVELDKGSVLRNRARAKNSQGEEVNR